jgi:hypothetical protein
MDVDGDATDLVRDAGYGVVSKSDNAQTLADAVLPLMEISIEGRTTKAGIGAAFNQKELSFQVGVERLAK